MPRKPRPKAPKPVGASDILFVHADGSTEVRRVPMPLARVYELGGPINQETFDRERLLYELRTLVYPPGIRRLCYVSPQSEAVQTWAGFRG
jgi:hypothetical protein